MSHTRQFLNSIKDPLTRSAINALWNAVETLQAGSGSGNGGTTSGALGDTSGFVRSDVVYNDPPWIGTLDAAKLVGDEISLPSAGYGIATRGTHFVAGANTEGGHAPGTFDSVQVNGNTLYIYGHNNLLYVNTTQPVEGSIPASSLGFAGNAATATLAATATTATTVTNGVYTTGSYADPAWITSLAAAKIIQPFATVYANTLLAVTEQAPATIGAAATGKGVFVYYDSTANVQGVISAYDYPNSRTRLLGIYAAGLMIGTGEPATATRLIIDHDGNIDVGGTFTPGNIRMTQAGAITSTSVATGAFTFTGDLTIGAANVVIWTGRSGIGSTADGKITLRNSANTAGVILRFTTDARLEVRNRTDAAYGDLYAAQAIFSNGLIVQGSHISVATAAQAIGWIGSTYLDVTNGDGTLKLADNAGTHGVTLRFTTDAVLEVRNRANAALAGITADAANFTTVGASQINATTALASINGPQAVLSTMLVVTEQAPGTIGAAVTGKGWQMYFDSTANVQGVLRGWDTVNNKSTLIGIYGAGIILATGDPNPTNFAIIIDDAGIIGFNGEYPAVTGYIDSATGNCAFAAATFSGNISPGLDNTYIIGDYGNRLARMHAVMFVGDLDGTANGNLVGNGISDSRTNSVDGWTININDGLASFS